MQFQKSFTLASASTTGYAASVTGASFALTANAATDNLAHHVSILNNTATDHSAKTLTLVGTDQDGKGLTEVIAAPGSSATVKSTKYFLTLTSITPSATIGADTFSIGWTAEVQTKTIALDWRNGNGALNIDVTGTINYTLEQTFDDIQTVTPPFRWTVDDTATQSSQTADQTILYRAHPKAIRLTINSYSPGALVFMGYTQVDQ